MDWLSNKKLQSAVKKCFPHIAIFKTGANKATPARTGNDNNNRTAVIKIAQTNKGILWRDIPFALILNTVVMKFIAPSKEETPAKCNEKIAKSTEAPECDCTLANGG